MSLPAPQWLIDLEKKGFTPYIATSRKLLPFLNTAPFGKEIKTYLMDEPDDTPFLEAYLLSNSLSFGGINMKMPNWVYIDFVLMQTAVAGFSLPVGSVRKDLLDEYKKDASINFDALTQIPISGQTSGINFDKKTLSGVSLFSMGKRIGYAGKLAVYTRTLAFEIYRARSFEAYYGVTQYDNPALRVHGRFTKEMEISQPIVLLHTHKEMAFSYKVQLDYDPADPIKEHPEIKPTFWLNATDTAKKSAMAEGIKQGKRYIIVPPFSVQKDGGILLPIVEKDAKV